ncbi:hypothetical protein DWU98_01560 [Dyella monticola]|uniref:Uncharacterized protein n=1 Tax=Dyella monticola TaxID=1927958 RepID=A0A370X8T7_9GAMM|nr:hypothetical protein [Dyella monticola]RDS84680.1 hypothetical protein DWU98_01560 [Dyella monticola]
MRKIGERFLIIYATVLTAIVATSTIYGFARPTQKLSVEELDVQRINLREPDGTVRLIISDAARAPGILIKGKEYPHPDRKSAGMIFYNDEGTENGGLIFGGEKTGDGTKRSSGHLSFDAYEQDQTLALESTQDGNDRSTQFKITDYPDYSILELIQLLDSTKGLPKDQQQKALDAFLAKHGRPVTRLVLGRGLDGSGDNSVMLGLNDTTGKPRILMKVASDGTPSLEMLDAHGKVISALQRKQ